MRAGRAARSKKKKKPRRNLDVLESIGNLKDEAAPETSNMFMALSPATPAPQGPILPLPKVKEDDEGGHRNSLIGSVRGKLAPSQRNVIMARHRRQSILRAAQPKSCLYFSVHHPVRKLCLDCMSNPLFDRFILTLIVVNSICLAIEDPLSNETNKVLEQLELIFNIIFTVEMAIRMVGLGVWGNKTAYLSDGWNRMDSFVVFMGWLPTILELFMDDGSEGANFTAIRVVRILKVLKTIQRVEGVRKLVTALLSSLPLLMNVGNLLGFMFFVFGIFGLQLFMGSERQKCFYKDDTIDFVADPNAAWKRVSEDDWDVCGLTDTGAAYVHCGAGEICSTHTPLGIDGATVSADWNSAPEGDIGFDNIFMSFLTILTTMSLEGWIDVMNMCWDTTGFIAVPYFILIVVFGSLFAINLVVAVIYEAYTHSAHAVTQPDDTPPEIIRMQNEAKAKREEKKRFKELKWAGPFAGRWRRDKEVVTPETSTLYRIYAGFRDQCYIIGTDENFGAFITSSILLNTLFMSMEFHGASDMHRYVLEVANMVFTILFSVEMAIKLVGMGLMAYCHDGYNNFDAFIVAFSWIEFSLLSGGGFSSLRTFRLLRVLRTLKLAKSWHSLNQLIVTVVRSIPGLANFGLILCLFLFIYALFGMQFYGGEFTPVNGFDEHPRAHFDSLGMSLLTVFQVVTGENWNDVLYACMKVNGVIGAVYASSMFCFGNYIVLNLFLAILLDNFQQASGEAKSTFYEEIERQNDVKLAFKKFKSMVVTVLMLCVPKFLRCCLTLKKRQTKNCDRKTREKEGTKQAELTKAESWKMTGDDAADGGAVKPEKVSFAVEAPTGAAAPSKPAPKKGNGFQRFSRRVSSWFLGDNNEEKAKEAAARTRAMTEQLVMMEEKEIEKKKKELRRKSTSSLIITARKAADGSESESETDSGSDSEEELTGLAASSYEAHYPPKYVRLDGLSTYVLDNTYTCLRKIHVNILQLYNCNDPRLNSLDNEDDSMDENTSTSLLTNSVRASTLHHIEDGGVEMDEMNSGNSGGSGGDSTKIDGNKATASVAKSGPDLIIRSKADKVNLESARHEALMDGDLKNEFGIVGNFIKLIKRSVDIRTRRKNAKTFMDCFTGNEFTDFLIKNKVVKDAHKAEKCAQMLLEIGLINLSIPPKKYKKAQEDEDALSGSSRGSVVIAAPKEMDQQEIDIMYRSRGASVLAMEWEGDSMVFGADTTRLYTIGDITPSTISLMSPTNVQHLRKAVRKDKARKAKKELILKNETSLCCLGRNNSLRLWCTGIVCEPWFDRIILILIAVSSIMLALDEPHVAVEKGPLYHFLYYTDFIMTALFVIEMLLKIVSMGFIMGQGAYLKISWNKLDFVIVLVSIAGIALSGVVDLAFLKSLRAMRGMRPLRMVSRAPSLKVIVNAIFIALPACINVVLVVLLCFLVFAICGSTFFSGLFFYCAGDGNTDKYGLDRIDCIGNYTNDAGLVVDREWVRYPYHFDSVPRAMTTLFEIASLEMWPDIMSAARDVTQIDMAPKIDASVGYALFFVLFVFIGSFFVINLFVGVVINKFSQVKAEGDGESLFLSKEQQEWVKAQRSIMQSKVTTRMKSPFEFNRVKREEDATWILRLRNKTFELVESHPFDNVIMTVIMVSILTMAMPYHNMSKGYTDGLFYIDFVWNGIFIMEMLLKWIGLNLFQYFKTGWNRFDCFIVFCSIADMVASATGVDVGVDIKILRVLRIARMVRLIRHNRPLMNIFIALWTSLPSLGNVGSILLLCLYVYAVMGMNLFSDVNINEVDGLEFINSRINFATFGCSMLTLFRTCTGESWNGIMHELEDSGHLVAIPYFISFVVMGTFIMLNLFIAVILENFADAQSVSDKHFSYEHIEEFSEVWADLDKDKDYFLESFKLVNLLYRIESPLGLKGQDHLVTRHAHEMNLTTGIPGVKKKHVIQYIRELGIRRDKYGMVFFLDVMSAMVKKGFKMDHMNLGELDSVAFDQINKNLMSNITPELKEKLDAMDATQVLCDLTDEFNGASVIQCMWRGKVQRREFYNRVKSQGLWTKRMDHMYTHTLRVWKEGSELSKLEEADRFRCLNSSADDRPITPQEELDELLGEAEEHIERVSASEASPTRRSSLLEAFRMGGSDKIVKKKKEIIMRKESSKKRFENL